jgi:hypothetical protein
MGEHVSQRSSHRYFEGQFDDEDVVYVFRRHALVMRRGLVISMLSWLVGPIVILVLTYARPNNPPSMTAFFLSLLGGIMFGLLLLLPSWVSWYFSVFIVTTQRFVQVTQRGFFHSSFADMNLKQIQQVNYDIAGFQQTLLGFGTMTLRTYMGELVIHDISHPAKVQRRLVEILRGQGVTAVEPPFRQIHQLQSVSVDEEM